MSPAGPGAIARLPLAGFAVPLVVTLTLWRANMNRLPWEDALPTLAVLLTLALAALAILRPLAGSWARASIWTGVLGVVLLYLPVPVAALAGSPWVRAALLAAGCALAVLAARRIPRDGERLLAINCKLNLLILPVAAVLCALVAWQQVGLEQRRPSPDQLFPPLAGRAAGGSPDVWHVIFDRYGSRETLAERYEFDNRPFLGALARRGFVLNDRAFSNYQRTAHSVSSTLNASLLDPLSSRVAGWDWVPLYRSLTDNRALRFFEGQGYATVFAGSWWNPTRASGGADRNINLRAIPELARQVLDQSAFGILLGNSGLRYLDGRYDQCVRVRTKFERLRALAAEPGRKYVFAHILVPHPPFVLNADGSCRSLAAAKAATRRDNYVAQVEFANREALRLVDAILASPRPAVIVIHADEGPWPAPYVGDEHGLGRETVGVDWARLDAARLREKMGVLMAVRHVGGAPGPVPASPVNVYPMLLRAYFGGTAPDRPARHQVFGGNDALYRFTDVGAKLGAL